MGENNHLNKILCYPPGPYEKKGKKALPIVTVFLYDLYHGLSDKMKNDCYFLDIFFIFVFLVYLKYSFRLSSCLTEILETWRYVP